MASGRCGDSAALRTSPVPMKLADNLLHVRRIVQAVLEQPHGLFILILARPVTLLARQQDNLYGCLSFCSRPVAKRHGQCGQCHAAAEKLASLYRPIRGLCPSVD